MKYEVQDENELYELAIQYDNISFDIFDTLLMRKTLFPEDVFQIIENMKCGKSQGFATFRKRAVLENTTANPNIYEIYDMYARLSGISEEEKNVLLALELQMEQDVLIRRETMCELLHRLKEAGKKIILITDMYLPASFLEEVMRNLQINEYDDILVSCEYRTLKCEHLFERYKEKYPNGTYLHIGDNLLSDIECSQKNEIDCVHVHSAIAMLRNSIYKELENSAKSISEKYILGMFISYLFNSPFEEKKITDIDGIVEAFISPLVYCMISKIKKLAPLYDSVLFSSRDGFILKELFDEIGGENGIYFYTSRKAVTITDIDSENKALWLANLSYEYPKEQILSKIFMLDNANYNNDYSFNDNIINNLELIREKSKRLKRNYLLYLEQSGLGSGEYLFVDLVSSGTCQLYLQKFFPGKIDGLYLCKLMTDEKGKEELVCTSVFPKCQIGENKYAFYREYFLLEKIMTSNEPSLDYFNEEGNPVFLFDSRTKEELNELSKLQRKIKDYVVDMAHILDCNDDIDVMFIDRLFGKYIENNEAVELNIHLKDDWMNRDVSIQKLN